MKRWAALLRGVNIGGRKLPMADLKALVETLGYQDAQTLLASGNVVFAADGEGAEIERALEVALSAHGFTTDVLVRDSAELAAVIAGNPFPDAAADRPNHLLVTFHRDPVPAELLARLADLYEGPERVEARNRELYIDFPEGVGQSKLVPAMAKARFPKCATARNWNTIGKLAALIADQAAD